MKNLFNKRNNINRRKNGVINPYKKFCNVRKK